MDKNRRENRRSAAREFTSSLHELEAVLQSEENGVVNQQPIKTRMQLPKELSQESMLLEGGDNLEDLLDEAAQDIERFMSEYPEFSD